MARPPQITRLQLAPLLMERGPVSATELAAVLGVNRTTIVRALADFGEDLVTFGATRSTRYVLRRQVLTAGNTWPLYRIDESGRADRWATLEALHDRRWRVIWEGAAPPWASRFSDSNGLWEGFPFFLADIRPQGFLGRAIAHRLSRLLPVPEDPRQWSDDHTLFFLNAAGEDLPGAIVVGDECLRRAQSRDLAPGAGGVVVDDPREVGYPRMAEEAVEALPESSAGGEQPKFLTHVSNETGGDRAVLVKFSPPLDQPTGRRWADLLVCESLAQEILSERELALPGVRIFDAGGRRFLEVPRFDRVGVGGRRGVVSLGALHPAAIGYPARTAWTTAAADLRREGLIDGAAVSLIERLHAFGELIGNSDKHAGNLAFWMEDSERFRVAPAYDMLPMAWAPGPQGELVDRPLEPTPPLPAARASWREAAAWAEEFWDRAAADIRLSESFADRARAARAVVRRLRERED